MHVVVLPTRKNFQSLLIYQLLCPSLDDWTVFFGVCVCVCVVFVVVVFVFVASPSREGKV